MAVNIVTNRTILSSFRTTLNTWATAINTLITDVNATEADILALQGDVTTLQGDVITLAADIALKQSSGARSSLHEGFRAVVSNDALVTSDLNHIIRMTVDAPRSFTMAEPNSLVDFGSDGCSFTVYNSPLSSDVITLIPSGCTFHGSTSIAVGESAKIVRTDATVWERINYA